MNAAGQQPQQFQPAPGTAYPPPVAVNKVVSSRGWFIAKIVLGSVIITFDVVIIGISAGFFAIYPNGAAPFVDFLLCFCPAIVSFGWQIAEFITVCVHRDKRGIHPGAHVGLHLVLWMSFITAVGIIGALVSDHLLYANTSYYRSTSTRALYAMYLTYENAELAFSALLTVLHFILFVRFCIECNRRNNIAPAVYVVAAPAMVGGMYYVQPGMQMPYAGPQMPMAAYAPPGSQPMQQQQLDPRSAHTSVYGGYYGQPQNAPSTTTSQMEAVKPAEQQQPQQQTRTSPGPALSEVSGVEVAPQNGNADLRTV